MCHAVADRLVHRAADRLPDAPRARFRDEWARELWEVKDTRTPAGVLLWAVDVYIRTPDMIDALEGTSYANEVRAFVVFVLLISALVGIAFSFPTMTP